jgi:outer membrane protein OmpA-like peptidoglycan-associated protein
MTFFYFLSTALANTTWFYPTTDGHDFFLVRDARSDVSGSWLSQTSQSFVEGTNSSFFNHVDLAGTFKGHRIQSSIMMLGNNGDLLGVGPITFGDKWIIKDSNENDNENVGIATFVDIIVPFHMSSQDKTQIHQPFGIHLGFIYENNILPMADAIVVNVGIRQDIGKDLLYGERSTGFYTQIGQPIWKNVLESNARQSVVFEGGGGHVLHPESPSSELLGGLSYLYDTTEELQFRLGLFYKNETMLEATNSAFQGSIQITWNTREESGSRLPKWEIHETRCTTPNAPNCPDSDEDGITDFFDLCPVHAEIINQLQDEDGCPEYGVEANINDIYTEIYKNENLVYQSQTEGINTYEEQVYSELMSKTQDTENSTDEVRKENQKSNENTNLVSPDTSSKQMAVALEMVVADLEYISETLDHDGDGINDISDLCRHRPEDLDNYEDFDGCPDEDNDDDGIYDGQDQCPLFFGDAPYGCPSEDFRTEDTDLDGIKNSQDYCPNEKETFNAFEDNDGCPDVVPDDLKTIVGRLDNIQFEIGKAEIKENSEVILSKIETAIQKFPDYSIRIEGHTDDVGTKKSNDLLSQQRAQSVLSWLVEHNIEKERIHAKGFGSSKPLASNTTREGQLLNRRVEIYMYKEKDKEKDKAPSEKE